jgi:uncharacterized damage-inducible protein DinB
LWERIQFKSGIKMNNYISKTYYGNGLYLKGLLKEMTNEDMMLSTGESNTIGWILGHIVHYRGEVARKFKLDCPLGENEKAFGRGAEKNKEIKVDLEKALNDLTMRGQMIINAIEALGSEGLKQKTDITLPGGDGTVGNYLAFLVWHETFHIGQIDLIKAAVGKGGVK